MKICSKCHAEYDSRRKDLCEVCYQRNYYLINQERIKLQTGAFRRKHLNRHRVYNRIYRDKNPNVDHDYYFNNHEHCLERLRVYRSENNTLVNLQQRMRYANNPVLREKINHLALLYRGRMKGAEGSYTLEEWNAIKSMANGICPRCGKDVERFSRDHVVSLIMGGSNYISNIQPLCRSCNCSKNDKIELYQRRDDSMQNLIGFANKAGMQIRDEGSRIIVEHAEEVVA